MSEYVQTHRPDLVADLADRRCLSRGGPCRRVLLASLWAELAELCGHILTSGHYHCTFPNNATDTMSLFRISGAFQHSTMHEIMRGAFQRVEVCSLRPVQGQHRPPGEAHTLPQACGARRHSATRPQFKASNSQTLSPESTNFLGANKTFVRRMGSARWSSRPPRGCPRRRRRLSVLRRAVLPRLNQDT